MIVLEPAAGVTTLGKKMHVGKREQGLAFLVAQISVLLYSMTL